MENRPFLEMGDGWSYIIITPGERGSIEPLKTTWY